MKRFLTISVVLPAVTCLLVAALLTDVATDAQRAWKSRWEAQDISVTVAVVKDLSVAATNLRLERGAVNFALVASEPAGVDTQNAIAALRTQSRERLDAVLTKLAANAPFAAGPEINEIRGRVMAFDALRRQADAALQQPSDQRPTTLRANWTLLNDNLTNAIDTLAHRLTNSTQIGDPLIADMLRIAHDAWSVRATVGDDRFLFTGIARSGEALSDEDRHMFALLAGQIKGEWKPIEDEIRLQSAAPEFRKAVETVNRIYFYELPLKRDAVIADLANGKSALNSLNEWRELSAQAQAGMVTVINTALDTADGRAVAVFVTAGWNFYAALLSIVVLSGIGTLTLIYVFKGIIEPIKKLTQSVSLVTDGNLAYDIPFEHRVDEIGVLAHGLRVFRDNAIEKQRLRIEKDGAEAASKAKSKFLANMSHELRTPLNAIIGFSDVMKNAMFGPLNERYRDYAGDIFNSGTHLLGLINEVLDLSKLEAGQLELHEDNIDLAAAVAACVNLVSTQARHSKIRLSTSLDASVPTIRADDRRLRQILINLLSNAVKFTPEGGHVRVSNFRKNGGLAISVSDTGIGMAPQDIPKAMMIFGQIDSKVSRKLEGTGLGLPLVKHLIELHGGTLVIESQVNVGTTVTIVLPPERIVEAGALAGVSAS